MSTTRTNRWIASLYVFLGAAFYGILSPFVKLAFEDGWNHVQITLLQIGLGAVLLWLVAVWRRFDFKQLRSYPWPKLVMMGVGGSALTTLLYNQSLYELSASLSIVLLFQFTWITLVANSMLNRSLPTFGQLAAIVLILGGTLLAVNLQGDAWSSVSLSGVLYGLGSACSYSFFLVMFGRMSGEHDPIVQSAIILTGSLPFVVPAMLLLYPSDPVVTEGPLGELFLWGLLISLVGSVLPTLLFSIGIPQTGGVLAAMLASMELPVALIAAWVVLGEGIAFIQWIGMSLILLGVLISELRSNT